MDKRTHILNIAEEMFARNGYDATSVRELAREAGVNLAMISYYFGSKEKLFEGLIEHKASYVLDRLQSLNLDTTQNPWQKLEALIELYLERIIENQNYFLILQRELLLEQREQFHDNILAIVERNMEQINKLLLEGQEKGVFRKVEPKLITLTLTGTILQAFKMVTCWGKKFETEEAKQKEISKMRSHLKTHLFEMLKCYLTTNH